MFDFGIHLVRGKRLLASLQIRRLKNVAISSSLDWSVKQINSEEFVPYAHYTFNAGGKLFNGEGVLKSNRARNAWAIEHDISSFGAKPRQIWYNPSDPRQSALQKIFPLKECLSAGALLALWIYFLGLGFYVGKLNHGRS